MWCMWCMWYEWDNAVTRNTWFTDNTSDMWGLQTIQVTCRFTDNTSNKLIIQVTS